MAERAPADLSLSYLVPDGVSDEVAAAIGNAGLAAWLPLSWRAKMRASEKVLVLGATGTSGRIAVAAAQLLGAGRVVAAGRNGQALAQLEAAGADAIVRLDSGDDLTLAYCEAARGKFDVVLDFLNGPPAEAALGAMATGGRMVQIGSGLAPALALHAQTARRSSLDVLGFAYYHAPILEQAAAYSELCSAFLSGRFPLDVRARPLEEFAAAWEAQRGGSRTRQVLVP
jgi:NADPH2:quinone reductase